MMRPSDVKDWVAWIADRHPNGKCDPPVSLTVLVLDRDHLSADGVIFERMKKGEEKLIIKLNAEHIVRQNVEAENAKLRELLTIASDMARDYDGDRRLLRRLVQELYEDQCDEHDRWKYRDRMRELGVKVEE